MSDALERAFSLLCSLRLNDGRRWGDVADEVQRRDARAALDVGSATPYGIVTRSRGYDKTGGSAGVVLAAMLTQLPPASECYYLAADKAQGAIAIRAIRDYATNTPGYRRAARH